MSRLVRIPWQREHPFRYAITEWLVDVDKTALLLMDLQAAYVRPDVGLGPMLARDFLREHAYYYGRLRDVVIPNAVRLLHAFRELAQPVVFTRLGTMLPGGRDLPPWSWRSRAMEARYARGDREYEIVPELAPGPDDLVIDRPTLNPFNASPLDQVLRNMGVENLAVAGVRTEGAPESAARSAAERGYTVFLLADGCATLDPAEQEATFQGLSGAAARSTDELLALVAR
jgi:nicotinamidase-related amidase